MSLHASVMYPISYPTAPNTGSNPMAASTSSPAATPSALSKSGDAEKNPFEFPSLPSVPPRLAKIGRRISEMSDTFLGPDPSEYRGDTPGTSSPGGTGSRTPARKSIDEVGHVIGMGAEPIFCPYCEKPLPPAWLEDQVASHTHGIEKEKEKEDGLIMKRRSISARPSFRAGESPRKASLLTESLKMGEIRKSSEETRSPHSAASPGIGSPSSAAMRPSNSTPALGTKSTVTVVTAPPTPSEKMSPAEAAASSKQIDDSVKSAETADTLAAAVLIKSEDLERWAKVAGVAVGPSTSASKDKGPDVKQPEPITDTAKPFPLLPPPPPPADKPPSRASSPFNFFQRATSSSKKKDGDDSDDDDDDDVASGYARLDAPASPERLEGIKLPPVSTAREVEEEPQSTRLSEESVQGRKADNEEGAPSNEELRAILKEVVSKVNEVAQSQSSLVSSHATLLTSLKIARSNLAMAEANTEMLEAQVKRQLADAAALAAATAAKPSVTSPIQAPRLPPGSPATPSSTRNSTETSRPLQSPVSTTSQDRRPQSIQIPNSNNSNAPRSHTPSSAVSATSANSEHKGMFGGFWSNGKKKLPGGISIPSAAQVMAALDELTPTTEKREMDFGRSPTTTPQQQRTIPPRNPALSPNSTTASPTSATTANRPTGLTRAATLQGKSGQDNVGRSSSFTDLALAAFAPPAATNIAADPVRVELQKLRQAYKASQTKMEVMTKELTELKKGKVEMEAELENLSQALFEEANKMVADERKKRAEAEDSLKEVKDEREALKETIKVLGGQVEEGTPVTPSSKAGADDAAEEAEKDEEPGELVDFQPRDLDKHYEALRKSIHHVSEGTGPSFAAAFNTTPAVSVGAISEVEDEVETLTDDAASSASISLPPTEASTREGSFSAPVPQRRHSLPVVGSPELEPALSPTLVDPWANSSSASGFTFAPAPVPSAGLSRNPFDQSPSSHPQAALPVLGDEVRAPPLPLSGHEEPSRDTSGEGEVAPPEGLGLMKDGKPVSPVEQLDDLMEKLQADMDK